MSEYPSDWEIASLGNLATIKASNVDKKAKEGQKEISLCNYMDVFKNPVVSSALAFMRSTASEKEISEFSLSKGDVLLTKDSEVPEEIGIPSVVAEDIPDLVCGYHLYMLRADRSRINPGYLCWALRSNSSRQYFYQMANGSTRFGLNLKHVEACPIAVPSLPEQKKIAEILSGIDSAVETSQTLLEKSLSTKVAIVNEFCSDASDTTSKSILLSELVENDAPICYGILMPGGHHKGGVPVVKVKNIANGAIMQGDILLTDPEIDKKYARSRIAEGDLLVTIRGSTGRTALVPLNLNNANITQDTARIRVRTGVNRDLLRIYLDSASGQKYIQDHTIGQAVKGINLADLRKMPIPLQALDSGKKYADTVTSIDSMVSLLRFKIEKLKHYRNSVASNLLSGRKRVSV